MCPTFLVTTKDEQNHFATRQLQAASVKEIRIQLREQGLLPLEIKEVPAYQVWFESAMAALRKVESEDDIAKREEEAAKKEAQLAKLKTAGNKRWYKYEAVDDDTRKEMVGHIRATDVKEARMALRDQRLIPTKIVFDPFAAMNADLGKGPKPKTETDWSQSSFEQFWQRLFPPKVTTKDLTLMAQQLTAITQAGLPIVQALHLLRDTISNKYLQKVVTEMIGKITEGVSIGECVKSYGHVFPPMFIELLDMGDTTGNLEECMRRLSEYMARELELQQRIRGAMTYPLVVLGILGLIVTGLMIFIVPTFMKLFEQFHVVPPLPTRILLDMSYFVTHQWYMVPITLGPAIFIFRQVQRSAVFKFFWDKIEYRIPIFGNLNYKVQITQMLSNLSMSLRSGLTVMNALGSVHENTRNHLMKEKVVEIMDNVRMGARLGVVVVAADIFPPLVNRLIAVGDETGAMDDMLARASNYMDDDVQNAIKAMTAALEPLMTLFLGGTVMFIVAALYFPLMGVVGGGRH